MPAPDWSLTGRVGLADVDIADSQGNRLIGVPLLNMKLGPSEPLAGRVHVERLSLEVPEIRLGPMLLQSGTGEEPTPLMS